MKLRVFPEAGKLALAKLEVPRILPTDLVSVLRLSLNREVEDLGNGRPH